MNTRMKIGIMVFSMLAMFSLAGAQPTVALSANQSAIHLGQGVLLSANVTLMPGDTNTTLGYNFTNAGMQLTCPIVMVAGNATCIDSPVANATYGVAVNGSDPANSTSEAYSSGPVVVSVIRPSISISGPASVYIGYGDALNSTAGFVSYQWFANGALIANATAENYSTPAYGSEGAVNYSVTGTDMYGANATAYLVVSTVSVPGSNGAGTTSTTTVSPPAVSVSTVNATTSEASTASSTVASTASTTAQATSAATTKPTTSILPTTSTPTNSTSTPSVPWYTAWWNAFVYWLTHL